MPASAAALLRTTLRLGLPAALLAALAAAGALYWVARDAAPAYAGSARLAGLAAPVEVVFGPHAIPHVRAASEHDLFMAQGWLTARERLWQMDLTRRLALGRLAEVLGEKALPVDRLMRTLGLNHAARRDLGALPEAVRAVLAAYAAGVNRHIGASAGRRPLEYRVAGFEPLPWEPAHSLAVANLMAAMLSYNLQEEITFLRLASRLGPDRATELFPTDEGIPAPPYPYALEGIAGDITAPWRELERFAAAHGLPLPGAASNSWALAAGRTAGDGPLLANDPHLAPSTPSIWYELELQAPGFHAAGITIPGIPMVLIGHNAHLAWGLTTSMADTQDVFIEEPVAGGTAVRRTGAPAAAVTRRVERIRVKGRDRPDELVVRHTPHGVVLNPVLGMDRRLGFEPPAATGDHWLALRWNLEEPDTAAAGLYRLNRATTVAQAQAAARLFLHASQNYLIAHRDGTLGWQVSGLLPRRRTGTGAFPLPGHLPAAGWDGYVPVVQNPRQVTTEGLLVTANDRTVPPDHPVTVSRSWMAPYRAQRIRTLLEGRETWTASSLADVQMDLVNGEAAVMQRDLARRLPAIRELSPQAHRVARRLLDWDRGTTVADGEALTFLMLKETMYEALYGDELGADLEALKQVAKVSYNPLQETWHSGRSSFWDDVTTPARETPGEIWVRALLAARDAARQTGAGRLGQWRRLVFPHAFHDIPLLGRLFDVGPVPTAGDDFTVNVAKSPFDAVREPRFVPSYRVIFTPADWRRTRGTQALGQSGHLFSPYRADQLEDWRRGRLHPWPWHGWPKDAVIGRLTLEPGEIGDGGD